MIIYQTDKEHFLDDVFKRDIEAIVLESFSSLAAWMPCFSHASILPRMAARLVTLAAGRLAIMDLDRARLNVLQEKWRKMLNWLILR